MRKIIITTLLFLIIINIFSYCFAFDIGKTKIINLEDYENVLIYKGTPQRAAYMVYQNNGVNYPAYCLNHGKKGAEDKSYTVDGKSKLQDENAWRTIINGFPYKTVEELGVANEAEAYTATKQAVFTILYERDINDYQPVDSDAGRRTYQAYLNIVNASKNSNETIINDLQANIQPNGEKWQADNLNRNFASKTYNLISNVNSGKYTIELQGEIPDGTIISDLNNNQKNTFKIGEQFKILIPIENLLENNNFTIKAISNLETKPIVYGETTVENTQNYALTGFVYEQKDATYEEKYYKNDTKITIIKKEYGSEKRLQGVKFNLLDEDKKIFMSNLVSDENGEIILENIIPGTYYLQEIETIEKYELDNDLIEIKVDLNEKLEVIVNNSLKKVVEPQKKLPVTGC